MLYRGLLFITGATAAIALVFKSVPAVIAAVALAVFTGVARGLDQ